MISEQFRTIRRQLGLTQAQLAAIMGMTKQSISRIECGERPPTKMMAAFIRYIFESKTIPNPTISMLPPLTPEK